MLREVPGDVLMDLRDIIDPVHPPGPSRLVRHHGHGNARPVKARDCLSRSVDELNPVDRADVAVIHDDGAIAIEKDAGTRVSHGDTVQQRPRSRARQSRRSWQLSSPIPIRFHIGVAEPRCSCEHLTRGCDTTSGYVRV